MPFLNPILAVDGDDLGKIIGGVVVVIFWIVSAIASAAGKRQKNKPRQARTPERQAELERALRERQARLRELQGLPPLPVPEATSAPPSYVPQAPQPYAHPTPTPPRLPTTPPPAQRSDKPRRRKQHARPTPITPATSPSATSLDIRRALTPRQLRRQMVMMEILQPPLALRAPRDAS